MGTDVSLHRAKMQAVRREQARALWLRPRRAKGAYDAVYRGLLVRGSRANLTADPPHIVRGGPSSPPSFGKVGAQRGRKGDKCPHLMWRRLQQINMNLKKKSSGVSPTPQAPPISHKLHKTRMARQGQRVFPVLACVCAGATKVQAAAQCE